MSLLMKALEKAAQDRDSAAQSPRQPGEAPDPVAAANARRESGLELEPLPAPNTGTSAPPQTAATAAALPNTPDKGGPESELSPTPGHGATRRHAAPGIRTSLAPAASAGAVRRVQPLLIIGGLACAAMTGGGLYVYLRVTEPAGFVPKPPVASLIQSPATAPPASSAVAHPPTPLATALLVNSEPLATPAAVATGKAETAATAAAAGPTPPAAVTSAAPAVAELPRDLIRVSPGSAPPQLDAGLTAAFAALQAGRLDRARELYAEIVSKDPRNLQGLLGLAATQAQAGLGEEAARHYARALELEPRNPYAQAGLLSLAARADPLAAETRLKQLIAREALPSLHFTLGNLYADQARWPEAQQSYFQAHALESANPDYAFNLAVSLEHVGQPRLAIGFYRRAIELAQSREAVGFNLNQARDRTRQLAALAP
jgi:tetratricopeptide (TPR) repeat protein